MADHYVFFGAEINPASANNFIALLLQLIPHAPDCVVIAMNSSGGGVVPGIAMYNQMLAMPYPIVTHNVGNVDSIATAVFVGGRDRYACPASTFMFHGVGFAGNANERLEENNLTAKLDTVIADHRRISGIFAARTQTRLSVKASMNLFKEQRTKNAQWALDNGIITAIRDFTLPAGAKVHFLVQ